MSDCPQYNEECFKMRNAIPKSCLCKNTKVPAYDMKREGYEYIQPNRREPIKPKTNSYRSDECFAKETVYSCSFVRPLPEPRKKPIVHKDHITMAGEIQTETEQQLSYKVKCVPVVKKIIPKNHNLGSKGHMIFKTTMRDDYNLPCFREREQQIIPKENLCIYSCPMESKTTTGCSYTPICANPVENYKPDENYTSPEGTMDLNTIQRTSYRQVDLPKKEETPWAIKLEYCKPKTELNATTVYNNSYKKPGYYVNMEDCNYQID